MSILTLLHGKQRPSAQATVRAEELSKDSVLIMALEKLFVYKPVTVDNANCSTLWGARQVQSTYACVAYCMLTGPVNSPYATSSHPNELQHFPSTNALSISLYTSYKPHRAKSSKHRRVSKTLFSCTIYVIKLIKLPLYRIHVQFAHKHATDTSSIIQASLVTWEHSIEIISAWLIAQIQSPLIASHDSF